MGIEELKRLAEAATPGPWEVSRIGDGFEVASGGEIVVQAQQVVLDKKHQIRKANAAFVAAANPAAVLELIAEVERLSAELAKQQSLTEAALQVAESVKRRASRDLALHADDTALRQAIAKAQEEMRERCAAVCDAQHDRARTLTGAARAYACAEEIRALEVRP